MDVHANSSNYKATAQDNALLINTTAIIFKMNISETYYDNPGKYNTQKTY